MRCEATSNPLPAPTPSFPTFRFEDGTIHGESARQGNRVEVAVRFRALRDPRSVRALG